jgi:hypothetical protein
MANLMYLELWRINGLADLSFISDLPGLQFLFLQSLPQVKTLPSFERLTHLRRILVSGLKGLLDVSSLEHALALEEAILTDLRHLPPESFLPLLRNPRLKRLSSWLGNQGTQARLEALAREHSVEVVRGLEDFEFRP